MRITDRRREKEENNSITRIGEETTNAGRSKAQQIVEECRANEQNNKKRTIKIRRMKKEGITNIGRRRNTKKKKKYG